ncbi:ABC transporter ATP-binding protein [Lysinibacter sp. HNR]|uniref:ABC transporter ATP-binding protein n=1 Tax=Lysinibacter sp. HNR TaxID=3031408 RepID=UPI002434B2D5|nr:ABC transporter ATP-binding protein [Lysinibacter sp. HNR]WGD37958.1 ABC transporter ATP-binding protein [Lysinibacter sp. HNR]
MTTSHQLETTALTLSYGDQTIVQDINLSIAPGKITSIIGANGCGKSTLLRGLARLLKPVGGQVVLDGIALQQHPSKELARVIGLLPQSPITPEGIVVTDLVGRGRHPHQGAMGRWSARDYEAVAEALEATSTSDLADRSVDELSGGQRQRVWIAMALAQETDILLLDEPTTHLDLAHQIEVLDLVTDLNRNRGTTVVMVLHDLGLAARYSDTLIALRRGGVCAAGSPTEIITSELVREVFGLECEVIRDPISGAPLILPKGKYHVR